MQRCRRSPVFIDIPSCREDVVVLPEVVGGLVPILAIIEFIAFGDVVAVSIFYKKTIFVCDEIFIKIIELSEAYIIHVFIRVDTSFYRIRPRAVIIAAIHKAIVVVASHDAVPSLASIFEISDVFVSDDEVVVHPCDASVVASASSRGAMDEAVCACLVISSVDDEVLPQQTCRCLCAEVKRVERTIGASYFRARHH